MSLFRFLLPFLCKLVSLSFLLPSLAPERWEQKEREREMGAEREREQEMGAERERRPISWEQ